MPPCYKASSAPGTLCLPVTRHHQHPMPPCYGIISTLCLPVPMCYKASLVPYASLLQGIISTLCLPVTRHHQHPMPPCYKASSVPYASLLQGIISTLCLPVIRLTAARPHQCPVARLTASRPPPSLLSLHGLCLQTLS